MWWSDRRALVVALALLSIVGLSACGFEPVYGRGNGAARHAELSAIEIGAINGKASPGAISDGNSGLGRAGLEMRKRLLESLSSERAEPRYRLGVVLEESQGAFAIQADDRVTRYQLSLTAAFSLVEIGSDKAVYSGSRRSIGSYNVVSSDFATVVSEADARKRAALDLADNIRELLIAYFSREPAAAATP